MNYSAFPLIRRDLRHDTACWRRRRRRPTCCARSRGYESLTAARARRQQRARRPQWGGQLVRRLPHLVCRGARRDARYFWTGRAARARSRRSVPPRRMRQGSSGKDVFDLSRFFSGVAAPDWAWNEATRDRAPAPPIGRWSPVSALECVDRHCSRLWRALLARSLCDRRGTDAARARRLHRIVPQATRTARARPLTSQRPPKRTSATEPTAWAPARPRARVARGDAQRDMCNQFRVEAERSLLVGVAWCARAYPTTALRSPAPFALRPCSPPQKQNGPVSPGQRARPSASSVARLLIFLSPSQADAKGREFPYSQLFYSTEGRRRCTAANCILNAMMRPRDSFIPYLQPYLERLGHASSVVAMHIRSGWAEDHLSLPSSLASDVPERLLHAVEGFLRPTPADGAARSCKEGTEAHLESMRRCGDLCRCRPSISGSFASGLRELCLPDAAVQRFAGIDPLEVLANASTRWALLNSADDAAFSRLRWHSAVKLSEACGPHVPASGAGRRRRAHHRRRPSRSCYSVQCASRSGSPRAMEQKAAAARAS